MHKICRSWPDPFSSCKRITVAVQDVTHHGMELEREGSREVVSIPATSFRSRNSNSSRHLRVVEPRLSSESSARAADLQATEHKVVIGATEDGAVNLLDDVDHSKQIYVCFDHVNAFVPTMVPGGGQYSQLLALPKAFLSWRPKLPYRSGKEADQQAVTDANREEAGHRQVCTLCTLYTRLGNVRKEYLRIAATRVGCDSDA